MKSANNKSIILILLSVLFLYGCLEDTDNSSSGATGRVRVSVNTAERTIVPNYPSSFTRYVFAFNALDGQGTHADVEIPGSGPAEAELDLAWGRWRIDVTAYAALSGFNHIPGFNMSDYPAARGSTEITVEAGKTRSIAIRLESGIVTGESGILSWDITLPESGVDTALLEVRTVTGAAVKTVNLTETGADKGSAAVDAGYYLLTLFLNGSPVEIQALHIYSNLVSYFEWEEYITSFDLLIARLESLGTNTIDTPHTIKLFGFDLNGGFSVWVDGLQDAMSNKYITLDLRGCAGNPSQGRGEWGGWNDGMSAFNRQFITGIILPDNITAIGNNAFAGLSNLAEIEIPSGVISVGNNAFENCTNLTNINIPASVVSIGSNAFRNCSNLTGIYLPNVTTIGNSAFERCTRLEKISAPNVLTVGNNAFDGAQWGSPLSSLTEVLLPSAVTIGDNAFRNCTALTEITLPSAVTIGDNAFSGCTALTEVLLPNAITIGNSAFRNCNTLEKAILPNVQTIGADAFVVEGWTNNVSSLTSITMPSIVTIGQRAFRDCINLTEINMGSALVSIGTEAFMRCTGITEIILPASLTSINHGTFYGCSSLEKVTLPAGLLSIEHSSNHKLSVSSWGETFGAFQNTSLKEVHLPAGLTSIGTGAFEGCSSLTLSQSNLPDSLTGIGNYAFAGCASLTEIIMSDNIVSVGSFAFSGCSSLMNIRLSESLTALASGIFQNCSNLTNVVLPAGLVNLNHNLARPNDPSIGAFQGCSRLENIILPDTLTHIGASAFEACTSLTQMIIPDSVIFIGARAFANCLSLEQINLPPNINTIRGYTFNNTRITNINLHANITSIGDSAFQFTRLQNVIIHSGITSIGNRAFGSCSSLVSVRSERLTPPGLGEAAFENPAAGFRIFVPPASLNAYRAGWESYALLIEGWE